MIPNSTRQLAGIGCLAWALSACAPTMEEVVAEHRAPVEAVFGQLKALDALAKGAPPVAADQMSLGDARVVLDGKQSNALFIHVDDLQGPEYASSDATGATRAGTVASCGEALRGDFSGVPGGAELVLKQCGRAEYAFVLRKTAEESATVVDQESFQSGMYEGDVLLFRLADGALLGGFRISATNSDQVMALADSAGQADMADRLESDLDSKVFVAIEEQLRKHVPGSIP